MDDAVIRVENLGKLYQIGQRELYRTLRETLVEKCAAPFRSMRSFFREAHTNPSHGNNHVWALKDVSFEVKPGEVVGIIGKNGAGKSTLLKVLSRITEPTEGYAEIRGRVGSLLEVGTGFHYELTGRENIYLSGAILGMKKTEIARKFDEIVAFAEVQKFLDTPVKHYSSGMFVRLAFAVAAHLEPDILLVDEVLAVGDAAFQKKCLGKMGEVAKEGRTILFVSHNMGAVGSLCSKGILLKNGRVTGNGEVQDVISNYLQSELCEAKVSFVEDLSKPMQILEVRAMDNNGDLRNAFSAYEPINIEIDYVIRSSQVGAAVACIISSPVHGHLFSTGDWDTQPHLLESRPAGRYTARVHLPYPLLNSGSYTLAVGMGIPPHHMYDRQECLNLTIQDNVGELQDVGSGKRRGALLVKLPWQIIYWEGR